MPISVTGSRIDRRLAAGAGFTLLEILVVLAIVAIMLVLVRFKVHDRAEARMAFEAERFVLLLAECRHSAVVSGTPVGIRIGPQDYALVSYRRGWHARSEDDRRALPAEMRLNLAERREPIDADTPVVVCLPTGEADLPHIRLSHRGKRGAYEFQADVDGQFAATWIAPPA